MDSLTKFYGLKIHVSSLSKEEDIVVDFNPHIFVLMYRASHADGRWYCADCDDRESTPEISSAILTSRRAVLSYIYDAEKYCNECHFSCFKLTNESILKL